MSLRHGVRPLRRAPLRARATELVGRRAIPLRLRARTQYRPVIGLTQSFARHHRLGRLCHRGGGDGRGGAAGAKHTNTPTARRLGCPQATQIVAEIIVLNLDSILLPAIVERLLHLCPLPLPPLFVASTTVHRSPAAAAAALLPEKSICFVCVFLMATSLASTPKSGPQVASKQ